MTREFCDLCGDEIVFGVNELSPSGKSFKVGEMTFKVACPNEIPTNIHYCRRCILEELNKVLAVSKMSDEILLEGETNE